MGVACGAVFPEGASVSRLCAVRLVSRPRCTSYLSFHRLLHSRSVLNTLSSVRAFRKLQNVSLMPCSRDLGIFCRRHYIVFSQISVFPPLGPRVCSCLDAVPLLAATWTGVRRQASAKRRKEKKTERPGLERRIIGPSWIDKPPAFAATVWRRVNCK